MNYYEQVKGLLISNEIHKRVKDYSKNKSDLDTYYNVGRIIVEAQGGVARAKYGNRLIEEYSNRLTSELGKGYSTRSLKLMRKYYLFQKGQAVPALSKLTWSHVIELLTLKDLNEIKYYIDLTINNNLGYRELGKKIKSKEYEKIPESIKNKHFNKKELIVLDEVKDTILINNKLNIEKVSEKVLKELILDDIEVFLKELGIGFCFIGSEYKLKMGESFNYIDILLYNIIFHCYVVVELKVTELKKEHIGQIQVYMNYIDDNIKGITDNKTIGLIIVRENNKYVIKYSSDERIKSVEYKII